MGRPTPGSTLSHLIFLRLRIAFGQGRAFFFLRMSRIDEAQKKGGVVCMLMGFRVPLQGGGDGGNVRIFTIYVQHPSLENINEISQSESTRPSFRTRMVSVESWSLAFAPSEKKALTRPTGCAVLGFISEN